MNLNPALSGFSLQPNTDRARYAVLLLRIMMGISLLYAVYYFSLLSSADHQGFRSGAAQLVGLVLGLITILPSILCIVFFLLWMSRAYHNLHRIDGRGLQFNSGWAAASWFIPLGNLVLPLLIIVEIWNQAQLLCRTEMIRQKNAGPVYLWWGLLIATLILSLLSGLSAGMGFYAAGFFFGMASYLCSALSAIYAIKIVQDISKMETALRLRAEEYYQLALSDTARQFTAQPHTAATFAYPPVPSPYPQFPEQPRPFLSGPFIENAERAKFVRVALYALLPFVFVFAFLRFYTLTEMNDMNFPGVLHSANHWTRILGPLAWVVAATAVAAMMAWMWRAYHNLHHLNIKHLAFGPGMAVGGWLIPLGNFYLPYAVLNDIARETAAQANAIPGEEQPVRPAPVTLTWLLLLLGLVLAGIGKLLTKQAIYGFYPDVVSGCVSGLAGMLCLAAALLSAVRMVSTIGEAEKRLFRHVEYLAAQEEQDKEEAAGAPGQP